ncbi:MAG: hypothetical protein KAH22_10660 [Thiotrichaceae bacterium]|nr:hypothetical protein [Thiotrichaceae bacterium]
MSNAIEAKKRFIGFEKIQQYREIIRELEVAYRFRVEDKDGNETFNMDIALPKYSNVELSEKIHGTNASFSFNSILGMYYQSRRNIITSDNDNMGCASNAFSKEDSLKEIAIDLAEFWDVDLSQNIITVYYEWAGGNIQKKSALTGMSKKALIFKHFRVSPIEQKIGKDGTEIANFWLPTRTTKWIDNIDIGFYNVMNFPVLTMDMNFQDFKEDNNLIFSKIEALESNSLVGEMLGVKGNTGEGYVATIDLTKVIITKDEVVINEVKSIDFSDGLEQEIRNQLEIGIHFPKLKNSSNLIGFKFDILNLSSHSMKELMKLSNRLAFKFKGEEHSNNTKVNSIKKVDSVLENKKIEFVNTIACTQSRLEQFYDETENENGGKLSMNMKLTSVLMKKVQKDIIEEEQDLMLEAGFEPKDLNRYISKAILTYMKQRMNDDMEL